MEDGQGHTYYNYSMILPDWLLATAPPDACPLPLVSNYPPRLTLYLTLLIQHEIQSSPLKVLYQPEIHEYIGTCDPERILSVQENPGRIPLQKHLGLFIKEQSPYAIACSVIPRFPCDSGHRPNTQVPDERCPQA
jgi:hypothetical protein